MTLKPKRATIHLKVPIAQGGATVVTGYLKQEGSAGVRVCEQKDMRGRQQFFPGHLVEKIEPIEDEK